MSDSLVSILIPCHNAGAWISETLESALAQTWPRTEIIVVDDGSTDNSLEVAQRFEYRGVRIIRQKQAGAAAARNNAMHAAKGDWIQYLDADDLLAPDKIEKQMQATEKLPPRYVVTGRWGRFVQDPKKAWFHDANPLFADLVPRDYLLLYAREDCMMHPAAWLVPRKVAEMAGPWDEALSLNDDGEYFARVVASSSGVVWCREALSYYRTGMPGSLSGARSRQHLESAHRALLGILETMSHMDSSRETQAAAADLCQRFAYEYYPLALDLVADAERRAVALGPSKVQPLGGKLFHTFRFFLGWKKAREIECLIKKIKVST